MFILFIKYIARCGFTVHGDITFDHSGHYCNTTQHNILLALLPSYILLLVYDHEDITLLRNVDNFSLLSKFTITEQPNLLHVTSVYEQY